MNDLNSMFQMLSSIKNPQAMLTTMLNQNPQMQALMNQMQSSGMNPQQFLMANLQQRGIDINQFRAMANKFGIRI